MDKLKTLWNDLTARYTGDRNFTDTCWLEIENAYTGKARHYHNLGHLEFMVGLALQHKSRLEDVEVVLFSIYYHDLVYKITRRDNEEKSAAIAQERLTALGLPLPKVKACHNQILATKNHTARSDQDTGYLIDFDLAILGESPENYREYKRKIRREYALYPNFLYNKGRKKVLQHFLDMDSIFKTRDFKEKYEQQARRNMADEMASL
ncbi:MAG: hypothetical protein WDZ45_07690 [Flavobacteriaceae bacterium]